MAIKDGTIIAVGTVDEIVALKGEATEVTELDGRALIPGSSMRTDTSSAAECRPCRQTF